MPDTANSRGEVHGGALATMLDAALVNAARSTMPEGTAAATVNLSVNYLSPGAGKLTARGRVVRKGRSLVSAEAIIEPIFSIPLRRLRTPGRHRPPPTTAKVE